MEFDSDHIGQQQQQKKEEEEEERHEQQSHGTRTRDAIQCCSQIHFSYVIFHKSVIWSSLAQLEMLSRSSMEIAAAKSHDITK